jgi:hypothetical protein
MTMTREAQIAALEKDWAENPRWANVKRTYSAADVVRLRGSLQVDHTLAKRGSAKLWDLVNGGAKKGYVNAFGAISAGQAMQQAKAGLLAPVSCCLTTAHRRSTGRKTCLTRKSLLSKKIWQQWVTNTSSSPWRVSTSTGTTASSLHTLMRVAKA